ncbi:hypothetical protein DL770_003082 [Monosporascus sp. CRB-9-2]|nr:hypothetical protein DL770_003082 [Monosporascus sp. CRB-9-2]
MSPTATRDVLVFSAQGSSHHLSDNAKIDRLIEHLGEDGHTFDLILGRCRDALYAELESLDAEEMSILGDGFQDAFREPKNLLLPPQFFQSHPILETITLYLRQILELMVYASCQNGNHLIVETSGVCTGVLPAIIASSFSSYTSDQFLDAVVESFRLAFWVGLRASLCSIFVDRVDWRGTYRALFDDLNQKVSRDSQIEYRVIGVGPGAEPLLGAPSDIVVHHNVAIVGNILDFAADVAADSIAVVGISANYPSGKGIAQFWETLEQGKSAVSEIPKSRFDLSNYYSPDDTKSKPRKFGVKYGNFLQDPYEFDPAYFNVSPREAKSMDPQQRLLLQASLDALEDAGYVPDSTPTFQRDTFGVYVGVATGDYVDNLRDEIDVYYSPAGRISYAHQFHGPSIVFDTACSSSLVAIHNACVAISSGQCTAALAGGVNTITSPDCKPFDAAADGYCRGEGCGLVVLKKLSQAIEEGDHIYGVIRGTGLNQCGTAKSITHPDAETQSALFKQVLRSSRTSPESISVIEAHGTGTQAGDYAETSSLRAVFGPRPPSSPLYLGSVKGNIGHAEAASGVAALTKLLLMMENGKIPPQASHKRINPRLAENLSCGLVVPTEALKWESMFGRAPRRALLNNFGAAGSNAALVLEEYQAGHRRVRNKMKLLNSTRSRHVLNLSAKSEQSLEKLRVNYIDYLERNGGIAPLDLCYTANARKVDYVSHRLSVTGKDTKELLDQLRKATAVKKKTPNSDRKTTVFVFPGQGSVYKGMGAELLSTVPIFRDCVRECDSILAQNGFPVVTPFIANSAASNTDEDSEDGAIVDQCACFVIEYALARLWMHWGIKPDIVMGHSIGEYAAFVIAESLSVRDALTLVATRAKLMATKCKIGMSGMVSCRAPVSEISEHLSAAASDLPGLSIACYNSPEDIVVAGATECLEKFIEHSESMFRRGVSGVPYQFLPTLRAAQEPWVTLASSLQSLWLSDHKVNWRGVYEGTSAKLLRSLPRYPLASTPYVVHFREPHVQEVPPDRRKVPAQRSFEFLDSGSISIPGSTKTTFITQMAQISRYIKAHAVGGAALCPASVYMEVALEALATLNHAENNPSMTVFEDLKFDKPLIWCDSLQDDATFDIRTELDSQGPEGCAVTTSSQKHQVHFSGRLTQKPANILSENMIRKQAYVKRQLLPFTQDSTASPLETLSSRTIYEVIFPRVVDYAEPFLTLKKLTISPSGLEGYGTFQLSQSALEGQFVCPPAFVDTLLHAAGFMANTSVTPDIACICAHVERVIVPCGLSEIYEQEMKVYCSLIDVGHSIVADAYAMNIKGEVISFVEGISFKKLQLKSFKAHLGRLAKPSAPPPIYTTPPSPPLLATKEQRAVTIDKERLTKPSGGVEAAVRAILREVCGIDGDHATGTLAEMGIDSLLIIELAHSIQSRFPNAEVSKSDLENCSTFEDLVSTVHQGFKQGPPNESALPGLTEDNSPISTSPGTVTPPRVPLPANTKDTTPELDALFLETCGLSLTDDEKGHPLTSLGVDSLLSIELAHELRGRFGLSIEEDHESISHLTFRQLEDLYKKRLSSSMRSPSNQGRQQKPAENIRAPEKATKEPFPQPLQYQVNGAPRTKLCLFHDGSGMCSMYARLRNINRTVHGVFSLDATSPSPAVKQMEDLAAFYIKAGNLGAEEEIILGGWSFGGVLAFEVSRQLRKLGTTVKGVILIDSPYPIGHQALPSEVISHVVKKPSKGRELLSDAAKQARDTIEAQFRRHARMLQEYNPDRNVEEVPCVMLKCTHTLDTETLCGVSYPWLSDDTFRDQCVRDWEQLIGKRITVMDVDCNHFEVFDEKHLQDVSEKLGVACDLLESAQGLE